MRPSSASALQVGNSTAFPCFPGSTGPRTDTRLQRVPSRASRAGTARLQRTTDRWSVLGTAALRESGQSCGLGGDWRDSRLCQGNNTHHRRATVTLTDMKEEIRGIGRAELVVGVARQAVGSSSATLQVCIGQRGGVETVPWDAAACPPLRSKRRGRTAIGRRGWATNWWVCVPATVRPLAVGQ